MIIRINYDAPLIMKHSVRVKWIFNAYIAGDYILR